MDGIFKKEQIYNSAAIATIFMDAYPNRFASFKSCRTAVCIATTELLIRGKIALINKQTKAPDTAGVCFCYMWIWDQQVKIVKK